MIETLIEKTVNKKIIWKTKHDNWWEAKTKNATFYFNGNRLQIWIGRKSEEFDLDSRLSFSLTDAIESQRNKVESIWEQVEW